MHLDMGLNLDLSQKLVMTPQLCQAITILQLSALDLAELVQQELLDNPVLDQMAPPEKDVILPSVPEVAPTPARIISIGLITSVKAAAEGCIPAKILANRNRGMSRLVGCLCMNIWNCSWIFAP